MKRHSRTWLTAALVLLPSVVVADESWDRTLQNRCHGSYDVEAPIDPIVAQGIGRCFLQLSQSPEYKLNSQRRLALEYADSWFAYATRQGKFESTEERAITQTQLDQLTPDQ